MTEALLASYIPNTGRLYFTAKISFRCTVALLRNSEGFFPGHLCRVDAPTWAASSDGFVMQWRRLTIFATVAIRALPHSRMCGNRARSCNSRLARLFACSLGVPGIAAFGRIDSKTGRQQGRNHCRIQVPTTSDGSFSENDAWLTDVTDAHCCDSFCLIGLKCHQKKNHVACGMIEKVSTSLTSSFRGPFRSHPWHF